MMAIELREEIAQIVDGKLRKEELEELLRVIRGVLHRGLSPENDSFFRNLAHEMKGEMKELALMIMDVRKDLTLKIDPEITELAIKYIPQATDQLEGVIACTEMAANRIMDNLEAMQRDAEEMKNLLRELKQGEGKISLAEGVDSFLERHMALISNSFVQMSLQDLTGQRIKKITQLVTLTEERLRKMIISFGVKLNEKEKNPHLSEEELDKTVRETVSGFDSSAGSEQGLKQSDIDELLARI
jgi:chemotaxis regulatin CheY-phosphate phosphatase CheZ